MTEDNLVSTTNIPGVLLINRPTRPDHRGLFREVFRVSDIVDFSPVQFNHSLSLPGVIRGLHAEHWNKLVYPVTGVLFTALVDLRSDSKSFAQVFTLTIDTSKNLLAIYVPNGVANSVCSAGSDPVNYLYLADAYYDGSDTTAVAWNDPDLNISWPIQNPIVSDRDLHNPTLRELYPNWHQ